MKKIFGPKAAGITKVSSILSILLYFCEFCFVKKLNIVEKASQKFPKCVFPKVLQFLVYNSLKVLRMSTNGMYWMNNG